MTDRKELAERIGRGYRLELVLDKFAPDTADVLSHDECAMILAALRAPAHIGDECRRPTEDEQD